MIQLTFFPYVYLYSQLAEAVVIKIPEASTRSRYYCTKTKTRLNYLHKSYQHVARATSISASWREKVSLDGTGSYGWMNGAFFKIEVRPLTWHSDWGLHPLRTLEQIFMKLHTHFTELLIHPIQKGPSVSHHNLPCPTIKYVAM